jgi:uncharacterized protein
MNVPSNPTLQTLVAKAIHRRQFLSMSGALALASVSPGCTVMRGAASPVTDAHMRFMSVPITTEDRVSLAAGYRADAIFLWGDPISDGPGFRFNAANTAEEQAQQAGQMHDGMHFFPLPFGSQRSDHGLLVMNHEFVRYADLFPDGAANWSLAKVRKVQAALGVSVIEIKLDANGLWSVVRPSRYARRVTALTPMEIRGPAAGSAYLKTQADPSGTRSFGTLGNCANGLTPWGTYLTCEENFQDYFGTDSSAWAATREQDRYGISKKGWLTLHAHDSRFDLRSEPNEVNRFGWVVELDPFDPAATPVKRTALGRIRHESAFFSMGDDGRVAIYTGDDSRFEYIYKFVTAGRVKPGDAAANRHLLDDGTLYVARFRDGGVGEWVELTHGKNGLTAAAGFPDQAYIVTYPRLAGDFVGATKTDRPEWIVVHPETREVYASVTGNRERGQAGKEGATALHKANNLYGSVIRWREENADVAATRFTWDVFVEGGSAEASDPAKRGTIKGDAFTNPDGLVFDYGGQLWITTDTAESTEADLLALRGNDAVLAADIATGQTRRFLVGPKGCEMTGLCFTPDNQTAFVNVQHPLGDWPNRKGDGKPRSATLAIRKAGGGRIGS